MNVIGKRLHAARELFGIGDHSAVFAALTECPAVVDDKVIVARFQKPVFDHCIGGFADKLFVDVGAVGVPGIPPHRRCAKYHMKILLLDL